MKRVVITGADGIIGSVLTNSLTGYELRGISPVIDGTDLGDYEQLLRAFRGHDAVIHLAWIRGMGPPEPGVMYSELLPSDNRHTENLKLSAEILRAARESGVRRVILASSVQADNFYEWKSPGLLSAERAPRPAGPYGAAKVILEEQGRYNASYGLEVICVRFGAVTASGEAHPTDQWERRVWLSGRDCVELMRACLDAPEVPGGFCLFYAVSDNDGRVHDTRNPFGWHPLDRAARTPDRMMPAPSAINGLHHLAEAPGRSAETRGTTAARQSASFAQITEGTPADFALIRKVAQEYNRGFADRMLALLNALANLPLGHRIDPFQHCLQAATRALRDGADEETVVCALFHDVADYYSTENHAAVAAEFLRPYISRDNHWMVAMHGEFQLYHKIHHPGVDRNTRERYRDHPCFERTALFCERWDQASFDPAYDTLGIDIFEPMVRRIFSRTPYAHESRRD
jgi:predicted HD phosphohydrolase